MRPDTIILHHSATEDGKTFSWPAIRRYHTSWRANGQIIPEAAVPHYRERGIPVEPPWRDIGYHYGIEIVDNDVEIIVGRMMNDPGAHCVGMNHRSLGVCLLGNYDILPPPPEMWNAELKLVRSLCAILDISYANVKGHRDFANKSCPGKMFDLDKFRSELQKGA